MKAYSRLYINETSGWISLSSVQGGWQIADSSYTIPNRRVRLNQSGVGVNGAVMKQQDYYPGGLTFNYTAPSWPKVSTITSGAGQAYVGAGQYVTIKRGVLLGNLVGQITFNIIQIYSKTILLK
ncbi:hypothetical protein AAGG43_22480 [Bacillus paranthracis]